jgi:hypothetical protein
MLIILRTQEFLQSDIQLRRFPFVLKLRESTLLDIKSKYEVDGAVIFVVA